MLKILTILGARPQFIKAGSVSREISKHSMLENSGSRRARFLLELVRRL